MKKNYYGRENALDMLYELQSQGYMGIIELLKDGLFIYCRGGLHYDKAPDIDGDFVQAWYSDLAPDWVKIREIDYWWLFD